MSETQQPVFIEYLAATMLMIVVLLGSLGGAIGLVYAQLVPAHVGAAGAWAIGAGTGRYVVPMLKEAVRADTERTEGERA